MDPDRFDALVAQLEELAERQPALYRVRVAGVALVGYGVLGTLFLGSVALMGAAVALMVWNPHVATIKLGFFGLATGGVFAWSIARGLVVRLDPPDGIELTPEAAPRLFEVIEEARQAARGPRIHRVVIDGQFNAMMAQRPLLGIVGPVRNHLVMGLPLLRSLNEAQAKAVIAHEIGHAGGDHGRFGAWIYRMRHTWEVVARRVLGGEVQGSFLVRAFLKHYWPWLHAWTFVLARSQEYQADRAGAEAAGPAAGEALVRTAVAGRAAQALFWDRLDQRCAREPEPPQGMQDAQVRAVATAPPERLSAWLAEAWRRPTTRSDTHPCLKDRLRALGQGPSGDILPRLPTQPARSAADTLLGGEHRRIATALDEAWRAAVTDRWRERHRALDGLRQRRQALAARPDGSLDADERWALAQATMTLEGDAVALPLLDAVLEARPQHAEALFHRGRIRLAEGRADGLADLEAAIAVDRDATAAACGLAVDWLLGRGKAGEARVWERRAAGFADENAGAADERRRLPAAQQLRPHGLPDAAFATWRQRLAEHSVVRTAWVVRVEVRHRPDQPWFLVVLQLPWWAFRTESANAALVNAVAQAWDIPGQVLVVLASAAGSQAKAARKLGEAVYQRGS